MKGIIYNNHQTHFAGKLSKRTKAKSEAKEPNMFKQLVENFSPLS